MGMKGEDGFRDFAMKRLKFAEFTSCENFKGYCGPILHGVKGMGKKNLVFAFYFWVFSNIGC